MRLIYISVFYFFLCDSLSLLPRITNINSPFSIAQLVNEASSVSEILEVAGVIKVNETLLHWEKQAVHVRKRQRGAAAALKRLAKMLVGVSGRMPLLQIQDDARFHRLIAAACSGATVSIAPDDIESYAQVLSSLALLLLPNYPSYFPRGMLESLVKSLDDLAAPNTMSDMLISSIKDSIDCLELQELAPKISSIHKSRNFPFQLLRDLVSGEITLQDARNEVPFKSEILVTKDKTQVVERRKTCWMADVGVGGLAYSGKVMIPTAFTPSIAKVRDFIFQKTGVYYDCCLLNLYTTGDCACAYHSDPDLGSVFSRDTVIVSLGETRRFTLRKISHFPVSESEAHHVFHVKDGDAFWMGRDCQETYQHAVMKSEGIQNEGPRVSIVFKKTIPGPRGRRGHGIPAGLRDKDSDHGSVRSVRRGNDRQKKTNKEATPTKKQQKSGQ